MISGLKKVGGILELHFLAVLLIVSLRKTAGAWKAVFRAKTISTALSLLPMQSLANKQYQTTLKMLVFLVVNIILQLRKVMMQ